MHKVSEQTDVSFPRQLSIALTEAEVTAVSSVSFTTSVTQLKLEDAKKKTVATPSSASLQHANINKCNFLFVLALLYIITTTNCKQCKARRLPHTSHFKRDLINIYHNANLVSLMHKTSFSTYELY